MYTYPGKWYILIQGESHPHLVVFTPKGHLLSYNQSEPDIIGMWPQVDSLWCSERKERFRIEGGQTIHKYYNRQYVLA